jgi:hypothetical protein
MHTITDELLFIHTGMGWSACLDSSAMVWREDSEQNYMQTSRLRPFVTTRMVYLEVIYSVTIFTSIQIVFQGFQQTIVELIELLLVQSSSLQCQRAGIRMAWLFSYAFSAYLKFSGLKLRRGW